MHKDGDLVGVCLSACMHDNLKTVACMTINVKEDHHELIGIPYFLVDSASGRSAIFPWLINYYR